MRRVWKERVFRFWRGWVRPVLVVLIVLGSFRSAVADWNDVPTGSMKPTILEGDRIFVNKLAYDLKVPFTRWRIMEWSGPARGDVVILFSPKDGTRLVKRVVGLPGDVLEMWNNRLSVNGEVQQYEPLEASVINRLDWEERSGRVFATERLDGRPHAVMLTPGRPSPRSFGPVTVRERQYFVMGDNRDCSGDSRIFGLVDRDLIVGRTTRVAISFDPKNYYLPRWNRFFANLP